MTEEEALYGFPLKSPMRDALRSFSKTVSVAPKGVGPKAIANMLARRWIQRTGLSEDQKPIYLTTSLGKTALEVNAFAMKRILAKGTLGKTMALSGEYKNLPARLAFLQTMERK